MYGEGAVTGRTCQKWFAKFCAGDFSLDNAPWSCISYMVVVNSDQIETLTENNQHYTTQEIDDILKISKSSVEIICTSLVMFIASIFGFHIS